MANTDYNIFDKGRWKFEAEAVMNDVKNHVKDITLSKKIQSTNQRIYMNLTTLENLKFCVELSALGFTIVDNKHDSTSNKEDKYFETPYSLLEHISPAYTKSFGTLLFDKLNKLEREETNQ